MLGLLQLEPAAGGGDPPTPPAHTNLGARADGSCNPWTRRMRSKYGVGASCWEGEAAEARESAVLAGNWQAAEEP